MRVLSARRPDEASSRLFEVGAGDGLVLRHITKEYPTSADPIRALDDVSLRVRPGEFVSVIGPSGCGKSTLFSVVGGLDAGYQGEVVLSGRPVTGTDRAIGMVFQEESTFPWRTVRRNVEFPLEVLGLPAAERRDTALHFPALVGLEDFADRYPGELSGGMRQRIAIAIARTLAYRPKILLMDEPFAALDQQTRMLLGDVVLNIHKELKQTTLLITHNITEAVQLSDRVAVMTFRPGRIKRVVDVDLPWPRDPHVDELFADPQVETLGLVQTIDEAGRGPAPYLAQPITLTRTPSRLTTPTPALGEHTESILRTLGLAPAEIDDLRRRGVI